MMPTAVANGRKFNFPEGTTPEQMGAAIDEFMSQQQQPQQPQQEQQIKQVDTKDNGFGSQLSRQLGLTLRAGVEGALALPALASDIVGKGLSLIPGVDIPSTSGAISGTLTKLGVPSPETTQEQIVGGAARTLAGAGTGVGAGQALTQAAPRAAEILTMAPGTQALSAASGGASAEAAKASGAGTIGQTVAGLAGGVLAPSIASIASGVKGAVLPTAADKLRETAKAVGAPNKLINQLAELGPKSVLADVSPGFKGAAQGVVGRNPATRQLAEEALASRTKNLSRRLTSKVTEILGKDGDIFQDTAALLKDRATKAKPLYEKAFMQQISKTSAGNKIAERKLSELLKTDAVQRALPRAKQIASNEGRELPGNLAQANIQTWDDIKQGLDDVIQSNTTEFGKLNKVGASVVKVKNRLLSILDENRDYKKARETFAGDTEMLNSLKFGGDILSTKITPSEAKSTFNSMNQAEKDAALSGLAGAIKNQIGRVKEDTAAATNFIGSPNNKEKIASIIGEDGFNKLKQFVNTEVTFRKTMAELVGGSQTQLRNAAEKAVNRQIQSEDPTKSGVINLIAKGFGKLTGLSDDEALKLTRLTATPKGKQEAISILKSKKLNGAEIRAVLVPLTELSVEITGNK